MNDLYQLSSLSTDEIQHILDVAEQCRQGQFIDSEKGKIVANLFFEPSTRTQYSFNTPRKNWG